jgi:hypothetical protein
LTIADPNVCSPSTTWEWRKTKVRAGAPARGDSVAKQLLPSLRVPRRRRKWQTVEIQYRGGPESAWLLRCAGFSWRCPGWIALEDALATVYQELRPWER